MNGAGANRRVADPRTTLVAALVLALAVASVPAAAADAPAHVPADPAQRVVVLWEQEASDATREEVLSALGERGTPVDRLDTVTVGAARTAAVAAALTARADVAAAEPDHTIALAADHTIALAADLAERPDDPLFGQQWGLENTGQLVLSRGTSTPGVDVAARHAWAVTLGSGQVTVAVIDSGVDIAHQDLAGAIWTNPGEQADGTDTDGNGFVDDLNGWDFVEGRPYTLAAPHGAESHGTHVAGVIAARSDDGFGTAGIAPGIALLPIRAFLEPIDASGTPGAGTSDLGTLVAALLYAAENGADIVNASWESQTSSTTLERAIADVGVPVVAAAGNRGLDLDVAGIAVPAGYQLPNLVAVTAIDPRGQIPAFANTGADTIDLGAPGVAIVTTAPDGGHTTAPDATVSGTSFAAPYVSGALALGLSAEPSTPLADLLDTVLRTTRAEGSLSGRTTTGGRLDAGAFVTGLARPVCGRADLPLADFPDVNPTGTHARAIDCIAAAGVTLGYADGTYRPAGTVTRGQLATFLSGIVGSAGMLPVEPPDAFVDDEGSTHERSIDALAALGVLEGDAAGQVRPQAPVTRGQLAAMLVRTHAALDGVVRSPTRAWFPDVDGSTHQDAIRVARDLGLVRGRDRVTYGASAQTRRDQMASTLARALDSLARGER